MSNSPLLSAPCVVVIFIACGCGGDPYGELIAQLKSPTVEVRRAAARELGKAPELNGPAMAALGESIGDDDAEVRRLCAVALGHSGAAATSSIEALEGALNDDERVVQRAAAWAIQRIDPSNDSYFSILTSAMREGDGRTILQVGALGAAGAWAVPTLVALLSHESVKVRALAAQTLGQLGPAAVAAKGALKRALSDSNLAVHDAAQAALDRIEP